MASGKLLLVPAPGIKVVIFDFSFGPIVAVTTWITRVRLKMQVKSVPLAKKVSTCL